MVIVAKKASKNSPKTAKIGGRGSIREGQS
jgi:hypothetical protein